MSKEISNDDVREFVQLAVESGVAEIEVERGDARVLIRRILGEPKVVQHVQPPAVPANDYVAAGTSAAGAIPQPPPQAASTSSNDVIVKSPIVGTYYDQAQPGDPPFVRVGDVVETGHVLCIIESMKLMNEIESEVTGTIVAKLMENGRPVEYGEALFTIRPR
jgi:acetyl-CoA carboxylase biotin carboxyl carrier protein